VPPLDVSSHVFLTLQACAQDYADEIRKQDIPSYNDGKQALYISKLMLVKMAHKDWTPIDRQWVTSQALRLRAILPVAVHYGCEGSLVNNVVDSPVPLTVGSTDASSGPSSAADADCTVKLEVDVPSELVEFVAELVASLEDVARKGLLAIEIVNDGLESKEASVSSWSVHEEDSQGVKLKLLLCISDHGLRLGTLKGDAKQGGETQQKDARDTAAAAVSNVDTAEVKHDMKKLKDMIVSMLGLYRPDKDSLQFRCCCYFLVLGPMHVYRLLCLHSRAYFRV
jgi:hypothetical protein